jgi:hypothetical protein
MASKTPEPNIPLATSPSPNIQRGIDQSSKSWTEHGNKDPKAALADKMTNHPVPCGGKKK